MKTKMINHLKLKVWLPILAAGLTVLTGQQANAQTTIAKWTFENLSVPAGSALTNFSNGRSITNIVAEVGSGVASGSHPGSPAFGAGTWGQVTGNGSSKGLTSAGWTNNVNAVSGDYYQFAVSSTGFTNINITLDALSSGTGPRDFVVRYSTDGVNFTTFGSAYQVLSTPSWNTTTAQTTETYTYDLSSITTLANKPMIYIRLVVNSNVSAAAGTVGTGGTSRIDNVVVAGTIAGPPQIITQPPNTTNFFGDSASIRVVAGGDAPLSYQWFTNNTPLLTTPLADGSSGYGSGTIAGSTLDTLALTFANTNQTGDYRVVISNPLGSVTSAVVHLQINARASIATNIAYIRTKLHDANFALTDTTNIYVVEGVVTTPINLVSGNTEVESFFMQDTNTGVGCDVFFRGGFSMPAQGDHVRVTAPALQFNGLTELAPVNGNPAHSIEILHNGYPLPAPQYFDFTTLPTPTNMDESIEGRYLVVSNVFIGVATNVSNHFTAGGTVFMTNKFGKVFNGTVPNNPVIDLVGIAANPTFAKSIRGVMNQAQTSGTALTNGYSVLIAQAADIEAGTPVTANPDSFTMNADTIGTIKPTTNDTVLSPDATPRTFATVVVNSATHGSTSIDNGTNILFTPDSGYSGSATILYTVTDNFGYTGDGVITVTVQSVVVTPIPLSMGVSGSNLTFTWSDASFSLQTATNLVGPWTAVSGATSPFGTNITATPTVFYRLFHP